MIFGIPKKDFIFSLVLVFILNLIYILLFGL